MVDRPTNLKQTDDAPDDRWWMGFFDDLYADLGLSSDPPERIDRAVAFLMEQLRLEPGDMVFDQCCGVGRLSIPLVRRGDNPE